jgi:tetratricopeptide (TPR) repeat protein
MNEDLMPSTMKWISLFIVVTSLTQATLRGQDLHQTFEIAEDLYARGDQQAAGKAFRRVLFFDQENRYRYTCLQRLTSISAGEGDHLTTLNYLEQSYFLTNDPVEQTNLQFERIRILIETGEYQKALVELYQVDTDIASDRIALYEGFCHYRLKDFPAAETAFAPLCDTREKIAALDHYFEQAAKIEKLNPKTYQVLSYFLPGLGQILLGDTKNSLNSIFLNGALVVLFIDTARKLSFFDATLAVVPWFYRYYTGGAKLTHDLAMARKEKKHEENLRQIIRDLVSFPAGSEK